MKFKIGQIFYHPIHDELFLVTDVDTTYNRAKLEHGADIYISNFFPDLVYIGEL